ncbi:MAG TPA: C25 family cysteine peptidase, partial [bacterium]|nr:C25 family cysteine peptidase [bacterium]
MPIALSLLAPSLFVPAGSDAASIGARVSFTEDDVRLESRSTGTTVSLSGALPVEESGAAALPATDLTFYVPDGSEVRAVRAVRRAETVLTRGVPSPGDVAETAVSLGGGNLGGFRVHGVRVSPVRWDESTGELLLAREMDVELDLAPASRADEVRRQRPSPEADAAFLRGLHTLVANPDDLPSPAAREPAPSAGGFAPEELPSLEGSAVDMVIVTTDALAPHFQPLADWKTRKGVPTVIRSVEWINTNYPGGRDTPERVRRFLQDAYGKWGTYLVLLGGDSDVVTPRMAWDTYYWGGREIASDQYFACLDGDWNADGDHLWGEGITLSAAGDEADLYPDLFIGRATVADSAETATVVAKSLLYDRSPPSGYVEDHLAMGEVLFPDFWEYGVDSLSVIVLDGKDLIADSLAPSLPVGWTSTELYQSENNENRTLALAELNAGHHLVTIMGHGDAFKFSVGNPPNQLIQIADTDALSNGDQLMVVVATACNPNEFDLECQGESFLNNPNGGAVAVFGPSREDFPYSASSFHRNMYSLIFQNGITRLGEANQICRLRYVPNSQSDSTSDRWTMLAKMLLGDPELRIWTREPEGLVVSHSASLILGTSSVTVSVQDSSLVAVPGALVCVSDDAGTYSRGVTDPAGSVVLPITSTQTGTLDVVVTGPEYLPHESTVTLDPAVGPHLALVSESFDDDGTGSSSGNGDGVVDAGESVELGLTVLNSGSATATGAAVQGSVEPGGSATFDLLVDGMADTAKVFVGPDQVNPAAIPFTLDFAAPAIDYIGRPTMSFAPDTTNLGIAAGLEGVFVWQDREGWHVRWGAGGTDSVSVSGTVTTDGRVRSASWIDADSSADTVTVSAGEDSLSFSSVISGSHYTAGVDFTLSDSTMVTLTSSSAPLGDLAASGQAVGTLVFDVANDARSGQVAYVDLSLTSTAGGPWSGVVPLVFAGPELEAYVFAVADSGGGLSGDGDGVVEVGETVRLTPTVINRGTGSAVAVNGSASAASGVTFTDAADAYGEVVSLGESAGTDGYVFTVDDSTGTSVDLVLTDSLGRVWMKAMDFVPPASPDSVWFSSTADRIDFQWDTTDTLAAPDLAGYNVYRSATQGSGHAKQNFEILRTGSSYADEGLVLGSQYFYYVTAVDSSGNESAPSAEIQGWTTQVQVAGWPQLAAGFIFPGITLADLDRDGLSEIYVGSHDHAMYGWNDDGTLRTGFPYATNFQIWSTAAFGDLDEDGMGEIVFGGYDARVYALEADGSAVIGANPWFVDLSGTGAGIRSAVTMSDVDDDGRLEILFGTELGGLYGFNHDGTPLTGGSGLLLTVPGSLGARI